MEGKSYLKFLAMESNDFETTIVDEANIPYTENGMIELRKRIERAEKEGLVIVIFEFCSNTGVIGE